MRKATGIMLIGAALAAAALVVPSGPALAGGPSGPCVGFIGPNALGINGFVVPIVDPATGPFYLDVRDVASDDFLFSIWLYQESNGQPGLQRGGCNSLGCSPGNIDPCDEGNHDTAIF